MKWLLIFLTFMVATPSYALMCVNETNPDTRSAVMGWVEFPSVSVARTTVASLVMSTAENRVYVLGRERNSTVAQTMLRCFEDDGELVLYEVYRVVPNCPTVSNWDGSWKCDTNRGVRLKIEDVLQKLKDRGVR